VKPGNDDDALELGRRLLASAADDDAGASDGQARALATMAALLAGGAAAGTATTAAAATSSAAATTTTMTTTAAAAPAAAAAQGGSMFLLKAILTGVLATAAATATVHLVRSRPSTNARPAVIERAAGGGAVDTPEPAAPEVRPVVRRQREAELLGPRPFTPDSLRGRTARSAPATQLVSCEPLAAIAAAEARTHGSNALINAKAALASTRGRPLKMELRSRCDRPLLVYWVDYHGAEVLKGHLRPGETFYQHTFDTHPWRIRDAGTGTLLREILPPASEPDTGSHTIDGKRQVVDGTPTECSAAGGMRMQARFVNATDTTLQAVWVNESCEELVRGTIEPGQSWFQMTDDTHAWRFRKAGSSELVDEFRFVTQPPWHLQIP
jgi:hypothetical protein